MGFEESVVRGIEGGGGGGACLVKFRDLLYLRRWRVYIEYIVAKIFIFELDWIRLCGVLRVCVYLAFGSDFYAVVNLRDWSVCRCCVSR